MNGKLVVTEAGREVVHELLDAVTVVGKGPDADLTLRDATASARHFEVRRIDQGFKVVDLESKSGTKVNGKFTNQHLLAHGDVISVGGAKITFMGATAPAAPAAKQPPKTVIKESPKNAEGAPEPIYREPGPKRVRQKDNFAIWAGGIVAVGILFILVMQSTNDEGLIQYEDARRKSDTYNTADMKAALDIIEQISKNSDAYDRAQDLKERIQKDLAARRAADDLAKEEAVFDALTKKFHGLKAKDPVLERECTEFLAKAPTSSHVADVKRYKIAAQLGFDPEKRWADVRVEAAAAAQRTEFGTAFKTLSGFEETEGVKDILGDRIAALRRSMTTELELWVSGQTKKAQSLIEKGDRDGAKKIYEAIVAIGVEPMATTARSALNLLK